MKLLALISITIALFICGCAPAANVKSQENTYTGRAAIMFQFSQDAQKAGEQFFYIKIPANIGPIERGEKFEAPLAQALEKSDLGRITGGGSQLGDDNRVEYCGIDVIVTKKQAGLSLIQQVLRQVKAPVGTVIEEYLPNRIDHSLDQ